jgi:hypothetical protein
MELILHIYFDKFIERFLTTGWGCPSSLIFILQTFVSPYEVEHLDEYPFNNILTLLDIRLEQP